MKKRSNGQIKGQTIQQDPIEQVKSVILAKKWATEADLDKIEEKVNEIVLDSVEFSENSPYPDESELFTDVYKESGYPFIKE